MTRSTKPTRNEETLFAGCKLWPLQVTVTSWFDDGQWCFWEGGDMERTTSPTAAGGPDPAERLIAVDPAMERIVRAAGPIAFRPPAPDYFNALARSIVFQQLAGKAALAIHTRFAALFDGTPTAATILQA